MNRWTEITFRKDSNCIVVGSVRACLDSFDHEFGTSRFTSLDFQKIDVFVFIGGDAYNITSSLKKPEIKNFTEQFLEYANEEYAKGNVA